MVALIMMLSPASAAASGAVTLHAAWHGAVSPDSYADNYGCGTLKVTKQPNFKLKTGVGTFGVSGSSKQCKKVVNGVGSSSDQYSQGGFTVAIPLKQGTITASTTSVGVETQLSAAVMLKATDGVASNTAPPPTCSGSLSTYHDLGFYYEWNYSYNSLYGYYYFTDYNDTYAYWDNYSGNSYSYSYSYGTGAIPSPFNLNNTSYVDLYDYWGADASCYAESSLYFSEQVELIDTTAGGSSAVTAENYNNYVDMFTEVYTQIDWECGYDFYWYGPSNYTFGNTTATCYSYNTTLTSEVYSFVEQYYPTFTYTYSYVTGTNNTQVLTPSLSGTQWTWFNDTFTGGKDRYVLEIFFTMEGGADDSWKKGSGSFDINMATGANGFKLVKAVVA